MKKGCIWFLIGAVILLLIPVAVNIIITPNEEEYIPYCQEINELIKNEDFEFAEIGEMINLKDSDNEIVKEIPFDGYKKSLRLTAYRADEDANCICYVTRSAVEDDFGYAIINNAEKNDRVRFLCSISHHGKSIDAHSEISGIWELTYIKDNIYEYSTMYPKWLDF